MNRRRFFQRLGLAAVATVVAPELLASPTNKGPILYYYLPGADQAHYEFEYMKAYKVVWKPESWLTILVLPKPVGWASHQLIIRDTKHKYEEVLALDSFKDLHIYAYKETKVTVEPYGPSTGGYNMTSLKIGKWQ